MTNFEITTLIMGTIAILFAMWIKPTDTKHKLHN
jgi:hypothetical protein